MSRPILYRLCVAFTDAFHFPCAYFLCVRSFRTLEERVREEDQQTITVEVELKRHDSEPTISVPQPSPESRYSTSPCHFILSQ